ncbi:hypothetical protein PINS_up020837 [Pythium insidiosum]|nr:hypothetical protein PINS_up020837 [Pythium insidiosum]
MENIGHLAGRGLRLLNYHCSREFHEALTIGPSALHARSCPPEAARAFVANESFTPTTEADIWQFGCLM